MLMLNCRILIIAVLFAGLTACSSSQFAGLGTRSKAEKTEDAGEIKDGDKTTQKSEAEQDLDDPQQVAGSFLTMECREDETLPQDDANVTVGCVIEDSEGKKADMSGATDQQWSLVSPLNFTLPSPFIETALDSPYHRTVLAPRTFLVFHSIRTTFKKDGDDRELVAFIDNTSNSVGGDDDEGGDDDDGGELPPPPELPVVEVGTNEDFQLGDDNWDAGNNPGCADRLQAVNVSGLKITAKLHVKVPTAKVGVSLKDVCGVTQSNNGATIFKDGVEVVSATIKRYATDLAMPGVELQQGEYQLVIESRTDGSTDHDDYIVGKIVVTSDGEVTLDQPTAP